MRPVDTSSATTRPARSRTRWASCVTWSQLPGDSISTVSLSMPRTGQGGPPAISGPLTAVAQSSPLRLISQANVDEMAKSDDPAIKRFLGVTPGYGKAAGVDEKWMYNVVKQIGNYGESFERNVGADTPLKLERGQNALWTNGGLMYAIPFR